MLEGLKRLFSGGAAPARGWDGLAPWAEARQCSFRGVREAEGFVVEGRLGALPWRLEWGPSQRPYVKGTELRIRAELALPSDLQVVVLNRLLQEQMEKAGSSSSTSKACRPASTTTRRPKYAGS